MDKSGDPIVESEHSQEDGGFKHHTDTLWGKVTNKLSPFMLMGFKTNMNLHADEKKFKYTVKCHSY
jgi:hypothetical protein